MPRIVNAVEIEREIAGESISKALRIAFDNAKEFIKEPRYKERIIAKKGDSDQKIMIPFFVPDSHLKKLI